MKDEIEIDGITYIRKDVVASAAQPKKKLKNVFECKNIEDLFAFAGEDLEAFKTKHQNLTPKKLNLELIEKGIEIIRGNWHPTADNKWYYPYFKRTKTGFRFYCVDCIIFGDYHLTSASLVLKNSEQAELAGNILLPQYNIWMMP